MPIPDCCGRRMRVEELTDEVTCQNCGRRIAGEDLWAEQVKAKLATRKDAP